MHDANIEPSPSISQVDWQFEERSSYTGQFADRVLTGTVPPDDSNRRRHGRIKPEALNCNIGQVVDFSASGLRVISRRPLQDREQVALIHDNLQLTVRARVHWTRKVSFWKHESGLEFECVRPSDASLLHHIAVSH